MCQILPSRLGQSEIQRKTSFSQCHPTESDRQTLLRDHNAHSNTRPQIILEFCGGSTGPTLFFWPCRGLSRAQVVTPSLPMAVERMAAKCFQRLSCHLNGGSPVTDCCLNVPFLGKMIWASGVPWKLADSRKVAASSDWILLFLCALTHAVTSGR